MSFVIWLSGFTGWDVATAVHVVLGLGAAIGWAVGVMQGMWLVFLAIEQRKKTREAQREREA